jgi:hypothetical protein
MDYRKASSIRNKSLLSLISEKKFQEGQGLGSSIGGAISDKFKAKSVGFKEKIDPLRWVSALTGKGTFGKIATTIAGRTFGRSEDDIRYFGGYGRDGRRKKSKNRRDAVHSTIGPGSSDSLAVGDSEANILAKMYNFMEKTYEVQKKTHEIELAFREEEKAEDERRHKKLIDSILGRKTSAEPTKEKEEDVSWIEKLMNSIKSIFEPLLKSLSALSAVLLPMIKTLAKTILTVITSNINSIFKMFIAPMMSLIKSVVGLAFRVLLQTLPATAYKLLGGPLSAVLALFGAGTSVGALVQEKQETRMGPEAVALPEKHAQEERDLINKYGAEVGQLRSPEFEKEKSDLLQRQQKEFESARNNFENEKLIPKMAQIGFTPESKRNDAGELEFKDKKGNKAGFTDYKRALGGEDWLEKLVMKYALGEEVSPAELTKRVTDKLVDESSSAIEKSYEENIKPLLPSFEMKKSVQDIIPDDFLITKGEKNNSNKTELYNPSSKNTNIPDIIPDDFPVTEGEWNNSDKIVSINNTNNIGGTKPQVFNTASVKVRNEDLRRHNFKIAQTV